MEPTQPNSSPNPVNAADSAPAPAAPAPTPAEAPTGPVVAGENGPQAATPAPSGGSSRKRWLLPVVIVVVVLILAGGLTFGLYLPNRPDAVYSKSLQNSGKAVDKLVDYADAHKDSKAADIKGSVNVKSSSGSFDTTVNGSFDKSGNGTATVAADVLGQKVNLDVLSAHSGSNKTPDVYLKVSGVKSFLDSNGLNQFDNLDGQWIAIDHTLIDTYTQAFTQELSSGNAASAPTADQVLDAARKVQTVNKQYVFTTDSSKAVLKKDQYVGKETKDGRSVYHYKVGYDKAHLQSYVGALKTALDSSSLNDWSKKANGKSLSEEMNFSDLQSQVSKLSGAGTVDMWVDAKTKLVHSIQFVDHSDGTQTITIAQNYTGGDSYPFTITSDGKDSSGTTQHDVLGFSINTKTNAVAVTADVTSGDTVVKASFNITPSDKTVNVTAPKSSTPITNLLSEFGLGGSSEDSFSNVDSSLLTTL